MLRSMIVRSFLLAAFALLVGCGSSPCEEASEKLCERACECGNGECAFGDMTGSISFEDRADCVAFFKFACDEGGNDADVDWDQCIADVEAGQCSGDAFASPDSCDEDDGTTLLSY